MRRARVVLTSFEKILRTETSPSPIPCDRHIKDGCAIPSIAYGRRKRITLEKKRGLSHSHRDIGPDRYHNSLCSPAFSGIWKGGLH